MKRPPHTTFIVTALTLAAAMMLGGCEADNQRSSTQRSNPIQDEFDAAIDRAPTAQTLYAMARILISRERDDKARFVLSRIIEKHPGFIPAYNELAELEMRDNHTHQAMRVLRAGLTIEEDNPILMNNLGVCAMMSEDFEAAVDHFRGAHEAAAHVPRYQANLGVALALMRDYDAAYDVMAGVLSPYDAHNNLATICLSNGDEDRAREELRLAVESR